MSKIVKNILVLFLFAFAIVHTTTLINAAEVCIDWGDPYCIEYNPPPDSSCATWQTECLQWGGVSNCPAGYYSCSTGCCEVCGGGVCATPPPNNNNCTPATNCPAGWTPSFGQDPVYVRICDQGDPKACSLGTAQKDIGCCTAGKVDENGDWSCGSIKYATYPCCPPGTAETCTYTPVANIEVVTGIKCANCEDAPGPTINCNGGTYDTSIPLRVNYCYQGDRYGNPVEGAWRTWCTYFATCKDMPAIRTCSCTPTCSAVAPSTPTLTSPADGANLASTTVPLSWNDVSSWGNACGASNNRYILHIGVGSPTGQVTIGSATNYSFDATVGQTYFWYIEANNGVLSANSETRSFTIGNSAAWWQVIDADVSADDISSQVPSNLFFDLLGGGGYPGVPVYKASTNLTTDNVSDAPFGWLANSDTYASRIFDYQFYKNKIPDDLIPQDIPGSSVEGSYFESGGTEYSGYYWYKYTGVGGVDLDITSDINLTGSNRKVVVLVENGGVNINGDINLLDGVEFFGIFVNGDINLNSAVTSLEGIYLSDGQISTGVGDTQLNIRGSVASYGGFNLQRDLGGALNNTTASEVFEYGPDQMLLFPSVLAYRKLNWKEVAP